MHEDKTEDIISNDKLHDFRKEIDRHIQKAEILYETTMIKTRENGLGKSPKLPKEIFAVEKVVSYLTEAKMWVGKILEARGSELPKEFQDKNEKPKVNITGRDPKKDVMLDCENCESKGDCEIYKSKAGDKIKGFVPFLEKVAEELEKLDEKMLKRKKMEAEASKEIADVLAKHGIKNAEVKIDVKQWD